MTRGTFGGGIADLVVYYSGGSLRPAAAALTFWNAKSGGTRYTDLLLGGDGSGGAADTIIVGSDGQIPQFQGPDGISQMWAATAGASTRVLLAAPDTTGGGGTDPGLTDDDLTDAFVTTFGVLPRIRWTGSAWPTRASVIPSGYTGAALFDSTGDVAATAPPFTHAGDQWEFHPLSPYTPWYGS